MGGRQDGTTAGRQPRGRGRRTAAVLPSCRLAALFGVLLAAATACTSDSARPQNVVSVADTADQVLEGFRHLVTEDGVRVSDVQADTARVFDAAQVTLLSRMTVQFLDSTGNRTATLTADRGRYETVTGNLLAEGSAVMKTTDGRTLRSPRLRLDQEKKEISSDTTFTYDGGGNHIEGNAFTSDLTFENIVVQKPRGVAGSPVLLPGQ